MKLLLYEKKENVCDLLLKEFALLKGQERYMTNF